MSIKIDDKLIDAELTEPYMRGDSKYSTLYREIESDDVPPELDNLVIAEAAAAVRPRKGFVWKRYAPLIAVAATTVLTVSVVLRNGIYQTQPVIDEEAPAVANTNADGSSSAIQKYEGYPAQAPKVAAVPEEKARESERVSTQSYAVAAQTEAKAKQDAASSERELSRAEQPVPEPQEFRKMVTREAPASDSIAAAAPPPAAVSEVVITGSQIRSQPQDSALPVAVISSEDLASQGANRAGPRETVPSPAAPAFKKESTSLEEVAVTAQVRQANRDAAGPRATVPATGINLSDLRAETAARESNPEVWLGYIRALRLERKERQADREWQRFVLRYPAYKVEANDAARPKAAQR